MDMMNFEFEDRAIRIVEGEDGDPLWVAKDVAQALGYSEASLSQMANLLRSVPEEWRGLNPIKTPSGDQNMAVLTEQGLYFFLGRSDKPAALPFQKWIAGEVLPSIRKTGSYHTDPRPDLLQSNDPVVLDRLSAVLAHKARLLRELASVEEYLERGELPQVVTRSAPVSLEPKVTAWVQEFVLPDAEGQSVTTTRAVMEGIGLKASRSVEVAVGRILHGMGFERVRVREDGVRRYLYRREKIAA